MTKSKVTLGMLFVLVLSLLVASCSAPAPATKAPTYYPQILVSPSSGVAAAPIKIAGSGFAPKEEVRLTMLVLGVVCNLGTANVANAKIMTNDDGAFTATSNVPAGGLEEGQAYTIRAEGVTSGVKATFPFEVIKPPAKK